MTVKEFEKGWRHFCECIDFNHSNLDADAIAFMNEMPTAVYAGLTNTFTDGLCTERKNPK